jgi:uncharacterized membrane protein YkoI
MIRGRKLILVGVAAVALGAGGIGVAQAVGGDDSDEQATGPRAEQAKQAALDSVGGGRVVGIEREDEGDTAWEVEVRLDDGRQAEVDLNQDLKRVGQETDDDDARGAEDKDERERGDED